TGDVQNLQRLLTLLGDLKTWWDTWNAAKGEPRKPMFDTESLGIPPWLFSLKLGNPAAGLRELNQMPKGPIPALPPGGGMLGGGFSPVAFREGFGGGGADL